jgi:TetR/AcrR family tetracycline transcriptional repressor
MATVTRRAAAKTNVRRTALDLEAISRAGLEILQNEGFDALSLNKIAAALGVQTPALYWHVRDRAELYGLMAETLLREVIDAVDFRLQGREWLIAFGMALRASHLRRRDSARLIAFVTPTRATVRELTNQLNEHLVNGGMAPARARLAQSTIQAFTLGWSLFQSNARVSGLMVGATDPDRAFAQALEAVAHGLARFGRARSN